MMDFVQSTEPAPIESGPVAMVKLFDLVLLHVGSAGAAAARGDFTAQFDEVMAATRIIDGLNRHLDMEQGGQVALNMRDMYQAISRALLRSVGKPQAVEVSSRLLSGLRDTRNAWAEISGMPLVH
jgi:flagellar protein FliS